MKRRCVIDKRATNGRLLFVGDDDGLNGNNNLENNGRFAGIAQTVPGHAGMKTCKNLYGLVYSLDNLAIAWRKARKRKTRRHYVIEFENNLACNLLALHDELKNQTYRPLPLKTFILRDPKTRRISVSDFRDRIVHHALCNVIEPVFDKTFIHDSCANRKGKGNLFALRRFDVFKRRVSGNGTIPANGFGDKNYVRGYCLKADIRHYFQEVDHRVLLRIIGRRIKDEIIIRLVERILENHSGKAEGKGMPLGNLTSQFFANVYLNELDYFVKHGLKAKYYIRYVDDFVLLHESKTQLEAWKEMIGGFLDKELKLSLHPEKSRIIPLSGGVDFVGFRNFHRFRLLRKRSVRKMKVKIASFASGEMSYAELIGSFEGWNAHAKWADGYNARKMMAGEMNQAKKCSVF